MRRDDLLEAMDLLDQLAHVVYMTTRGTAHEDKARDISDRIGKLNQRVGADAISELTAIVDPRNVLDFPPQG